MLKWLALCGLLTASAPRAALGQPPVLPDTGGIVIHATWVYDAVVKDTNPNTTLDDTLYFTTESTSTAGAVYKVINDSSVTKLARFNNPCLCFGYVQETLFVGLKNSGKVLRSDNGGTVWDTTGQLGGVASVYALLRCSTGAFLAATGNNNGDVFQAVWNSNEGGAVLPGPTWANGTTVHGNTFYCCTDFDTSELWKSSDTGRTWTRVNRNFPGTMAYDVFWDQETMYVGLNNSRGVWRSTNAGVSWDSTAIPGGISDVYCFLKPQGRDFLIGTGNTYGDVFQACYSTFVGGSVISGPNWANGMTSHANTLFSTTNFDTSEIWKSSDTGRTWTRINQNFPGTVAYDVFWDQETMYVGLNNSRGVWRSTNAGVSWDSTAKPGGISDIYCFLKPQGRDFLIGTGNTYGDIFQACYSTYIGGGVMSGPRWTNDMTAHAGTLFACTDFDTAELWKSTDTGHTWTRVDHNFPGTQVRAMHWDGDTAYVGMNNSQGVQRSNDGGTTWLNTVKPPDASDVYAFCQPDTGEFVVGTGNTNGDVFKAVFMSEVGGAELAGANWVHAAGAQGDELWAAAGTDTGQVWRWTPSPDTWRKTASPPANNILAIEPVGQNIYAGTDDSGKVYVSYDSGSTWLRTWPPPGANKTYSLLLSRWARPAKLLAATGDNLGDVFVSDRSVAPDVGVTRLLAPQGIVRFDTVITPTAIVKNFGFSTASFPTVMNIGPHYSETLQVALPQDSLDTLYFPTWRASPAGTYAVKCSTMYVEDYAPGNDFQDTTVAVDSAGIPLITSVDPSMGGNTGCVTVTITGRRFQPGARVKLTKAGQPDIVVDSSWTSVPDSTRLEFCVFPDGAALGMRNIVVSNPGGSSTSYYDGFTLELATVQLWAEISGRSQIRRGVPESYAVRFGNRGNVDVCDAAIWVSVPRDIECEVRAPKAESLMWGRDGETLASDDSTERFFWIHVPWVVSGTEEELGLTVTSLGGPHSRVPIRTQIFEHHHWNPDSSFPRLGQCGRHADNPSSKRPSQASVVGSRFDPQPGEILFAAPNPPLTLWGHVAIMGSDGFVYDMIPDGPSPRGGVRGIVRRLPFSQWVSMHPTYIGAFPPPGWSLEKAQRATLKLQYSKERSDRGELDYVLGYDLTSYQAFGQGDCISLVRDACEFGGYPLLSFGEWLVTPGRVYQIVTGKPFLWPLRLPVSILFGLAEGFYKSWAQLAITLLAEVLTSWDPNAKSGPCGYDSLARFVSGSRPLHYALSFENVDSATAPAETVVVTDRLDDNLDWSTLRLDTVSHPAVCRTLLDSVNRTITWRFDSIMLPPNRNPPEGEGFCQFSIMPRQDLPSGIQIRNCATVVFDRNPPMNTDTVLNTIDAFPPTSNVRALPETTQTGEFTVRWTGADDLRGSGIRSYDIYVKRDTGDFEAWLVGTTDTAATFIGANESRYWFYTVATDNVGWREDVPANPDAQTFVNGMAAPVMLYPPDTTFTNDTTPSFLWTATAGSQGTYVLQYSRDSQFVVGIESVPGLTDTTYTVPDLSALSDTTWFWRVKAISRRGTPSAYRDTWRLTVDTRAPETPDLLAPADSSVTNDSTPTFVWSSVSGQGIRYSMLCALDTGFSQVVAGTFTSDTNYTVPDAYPLDDTTYFWHVRAVDRAGNSSAYQPRPYLLRVVLLRSISGEVTYYYTPPDTPVGNASMVLSGAIADTVLTDTTGHYGFAGLFNNGNYRVTPRKLNAGREQAVSSFDAAKVLQHVVHIDTLDTLQQVAGDVTGGGLSSFDAAQILRYSVGMIQRFPIGGDSSDWAFRPWRAVYEPLTRDTVENYKGILYGDPSGDWPGLDLLASAPTGDDAGVRYFSLNMPGESSSQEPIGRGQYGSSQVKVQSAKGKGQNGNLGMTNDEFLMSSQSLSTNAQGRERSAVGTELPSVSREPSAAVIFPVVAHGARDAVSADILVRYDSRRYTLDAIRTTQATEGFMVAAADRSGAVRISMAGTRKLNSDVTLLELVFEPATGVAAQAPSLKLQTPASDGTLNQETASTSEAVSRQPSTVSDVPIGPVPEPSAVSREPLANIVWLVLNEGVVQPGAQHEGAMGDAERLPTAFYLAPPKPNPFGGGTCISYGLPVAAEVRLAVFDATGRKVRTLVNSSQPAGRYSATWNGKDNANKRLANGIYFARMQAGRTVFERKVTLLHQ
jgi:photosystem II stability/assembly factor-like uncharacterized protein